MSKTFIATAGKSQNTTVYSGECPITTALEIATRQNYDRAAGLSLKDQKGVNRSWDQKRSLHIARGYEMRLSTKQPLEHGAIILIDPNKVVRATAIGKSSAVNLAIPDDAKLPFIDRQHTTGGLEMGIKEPTTYPLLHKYVTDPANTVTVKLIQCDEREGRKRFELLNYQPKQLSPVEKMWAATINALDYEEAGEPGAYKENLPVIVSFMAWHDIAEDTDSVWHEKLIVDSNVTKPAPKKNAIPVRSLVDEATVIYRFYEKFDPDFNKLTIEKQAGRIKDCLNSFWKSVGLNLKEATGDKWYNYLALKRGAKLMMKCFAGLIRYKLMKKKKMRGEDHDFMKLNFHEFCTEGVIEFFLDKADDGSPWKNDNYWSDRNDTGYSTDGDDKALEYMWKKLNLYSVNKWYQFVNSASTNEWHNVLRDRAKKNEVKEKTEEETEEVIGV